MQRAWIAWSMDRCGREGNALHAKPMTIIAITCSPLREWMPSSSVPVTAPLVARVTAMSAQTDGSEGSGNGGAGVLGEVLASASPAPVPIEQEVRVVCNCLCNCLAFCRLTRVLSRQRARL